MNRDMSPMPRYQCHERVWALKILEIQCDALQTTDGEGLQTNTRSGVRLVVGEGFEPIFVPDEWVDRHCPAVGGYYVVDDDGRRTSYSPAKAFEDGYTRLN